MKHLLLLTLALVSCSSFEPNVGEQLEEQCSDADSDTAKRVSYASDIRPILEARCFFCHSPQGRAPIGIEIGGLDLSRYESMRAGGVVSGTRIIVPGSPCSSLLIDKIEEYPPFGGRMPLSGPPFLSDDQIQLFADWIAEGAREE